MGWKIFTAFRSRREARDRLLQRFGEDANVSSREADAILSRMAGLTFDTGALIGFDGLGGSARRHRLHVRLQ
jgi:hypothetical protein